MIAGYEIKAETPSIDDYRRLRVAAGLSPKTRAAAERGLPNSVFAVVVHFQGRPIGMGRIIGDGGTFLQVVDIAVEPAHQGRGLGKAIVGALVKHLRANHSGAYVSLIADGEANRLYAQFGFEPTAPASIGMALVVP